LTVIVTHISEFGIVHGADSNLTNAAANLIGTGKKVFPVPRLACAVSVAGCYAVAGERVDSWLPHYIAANKSRSLASFGKSLADRINREAASSGTKDGYFWHLAGYSTGKGGTHPALYKITNLDIDPKTGGYKPTGKPLICSEEFWSAHGHRTHADLFAPGNGYIYCNGFPSGRAAYLVLLKQMAEYRSQVWQTRGWKFRRTKSVHEDAGYLKADMEQITALFKASDYPPVIGGDIEIHAIPSP
jgi:hypothetical protein